METYSVMKFLFDIDMRPLCLSALGEEEDDCQDFDCQFSHDDAFYQCSIPVTQGSLENLDELRKFLIDYIKDHPECIDDMEDDFTEDDTNSWFPNSRNCQCCSGYRYKCSCQSHQCARCGEA